MTLSRLFQLPAQGLSLFFISSFTFKEAVLEFLTVWVAVGGVGRSGIHLARFQMACTAGS